ncbi:MAG: IPT/TIG domain-containing protein [Acidobacteriaceae bacterium]|nr:IPT/TIG domain-containing protein [Acidobacteriaceae bacterium]
MLSAVLVTSLAAQDFKKQVIYEIITDRFVDGDTTNDNPPQSPGLYDSTHTNWYAYWGGDLAGIQQKMSYLKGMGVTAIWISPPADNINIYAYGSASSPQVGYHGYWARDFMRIEEHFGDSSNSWTAFDNLVSAAHTNGIKVVVDFAANHSNPDNGGEYGSLYNNGAFMAAWNNDPNGYFHHNGNITNYDDRYQLQYYELEDLSDLNQENSTIDSYLKTAIAQFVSHGVDAFRLDAVKDVTWGWEYSFANSVFSSGGSFFFGEWDQGNTSDPLYHDSYKFANKSGISLLDFPLNTAIRDVFASNNNFSEIDSTLSTEASNFIWSNDLTTFIDSQDLSRFLTLNNNQNRLNEAIAFLLTCRGIPIIYYGDEQYLHNDTNGGGDPYNRPMMASFSTTTTAYQLINKLAGLRQSNNALAYGTSQQRWINNDVYIFERQFYNNVVLVAVNKNDTTSYNITGLYTALPAGTYTDYLGGLLGGTGLSVSTGSGSNNPAAALTLGAHSVSVWQLAGGTTAPAVGSIGPTIAQPGVVVTIAGQNFGSATGTISFNGTHATINSWSTNQITFTVPNVGNGVYQVQLANSSGTDANTIQFTVLTAKLIPVTFTVDNATPTNTGDYIFVAGNTIELGQWGTTFDTAIGPMLDPNYPNWFLNVSLPAGQNVQFKFIKIAANGTVTWENGSNHQYTVPTSGTGNVTVNWQY